MEGVRVPEGRVDVLFVMDAPSFGDDDKGVLASDKYGALLQQVAKMMLPEYGWYVSAAVRCQPGSKPNGKPNEPLKEQIIRCKTYLDDEVRYLQPKVIVPMGKASLYATTGLPLTDCKITHLAGTVQESEWGIPVVPIRSPFWAGANPEANLPQWEAEWARIKEVLTGEWTGLKGEYRWETDPDAIRDWYALMFKNAKKSNFRLAFDYETDSLDPRTGAFRMVGYGLSETEAFVHPLIEKWQVDLHKALLAVCNTVAVHHMLFECEWFYHKTGKMIPSKVIDTKALAFLHNENMSMKLADLTAAFAPEYAGFKSESEMADVDITELPDEILARRCAYDCMATFKIAKVLSEKLSPEQSELYLRIIEPALKVVAKCKEHGWKVDNEALCDVQEELTGIMSEATATTLADPDIHKFRQEERKRLTMVALPDWNMNSVQTWQRFFKSVGIVPRDFDECTESDQKLIKRKKKKIEECLIATSKEVLEPRSDEHPMVEVLLTYNEAKHTYSHFIRAIGKYSEYDGFLHPGYNWGGQVRAGGAKGTVTARLSSAKPNVMNPPKGIRKIFVSRFEGGKIVQADYKQLEMRIAAVGCPEPVWEAAFRANIDLHQASADAMGQTRSNAKNLNYGKMYGQGPAAFAKKAKLPFDKAKEIFATWEAKHTGFTAFTAKKHAEAERYRKVSGFFAQVLHVPDATSDDSEARSHALNKAANFPYQNGAGYITLLAMAVLDRLIESKGLKALIVGQMHDAIIVDCPKEEVPKVKELLQEAMIVQVHAQLPWLRGILDIDFTVGRTYYGNPLRKED